MAVYTKLTEIELKSFFLKYDLGKLINYKEIKEGIENKDSITTIKYVLRQYSDQTKRKLTLEYTLIKNVNENKTIRSIWYFFTICISNIIDCWKFFYKHFYI